MKKLILIVAFIMWANVLLAHETNLSITQISTNGKCILVEVKYDKHDILQAMKWDQSKGLTDEVGLQKAIDNYFLKHLAIFVDQKRQKLVLNSVIVDDEYVTVKGEVKRKVFGDSRLHVVNTSFFERKKEYAHLVAVHSKAGDQSFRLTKKTNYLEMAI